MHHEWAKVLDKVETARKKLGCARSGAYYRGHSRSDHLLVPTLLRANLNPEIEKNLYAETYIHAHADIRDCNSSWETLSLLQHYGIPTRLLDWTDSFAVAVFFAVAAEPLNPVVWTLNPFRMTQYVTGAKKPFIFTVGIDTLPDYHKCYIEQTTQWPYKEPIFLEIPWNSKRVISQRGYFTFHSDHVPLEVACDKFVRKIEIPESAIKAANRFLELAGVNEHSIFPDLAGLGAFLRNKYKL